MATIKQIKNRAHGGHVNILKSLAGLEHGRRGFGPMEYGTCLATLTRWECIEKGGRNFYRMTEKGRELLQMFLDGEKERAEAFKKSRGIE